MKKDHKVYGILLIIGAVAFFALSEIFHYFTYVVFKPGSLPYFLYMVCKNNLPISILIAMAGFQFFLIGKQKIRLVFLSTVSLVILVWVYSLNKIDADTSYEPLHFSFDKEYSVRLFLKEMESQGFRKVLKKIEEHDAKILTDSAQMVRADVFPYTFVRISKLGFEEEVTVEGFSDYFVDSIPLLDKEVLSFAQTIKCSPENNYQQLKAVFNKHFKWVKEKYHSNPDLVYYSEYKLDFWAGGFGRNSRLVNEHAQDLIDYKWDSDENVSFNTLVSIDGLPDKEIDDLIQDNTTVTIVPVVTIGYFKFKFQ